MSDVVIVSDADAGSTEEHVETSENVAEIADAATEVVETQTDAAVEIAQIEADTQLAIAQEHADVAHHEIDVRAETERELAECRTTIANLTSRLTQAELDLASTRLELEARQNPPSQEEVDVSVEVTPASQEAPEEPAARPRRFHRWT